MELHQIKHFVAVAETGGFTKGAQRVAVSQPAISTSIAKLEAELDVKLLDRRPFHVVPTPAGVRFLEVGKEILRTCNAVKAELKTITAPNRFRIGVLQSLPSGCVSKLLSSFQRANSHVAIEVCDRSSEELVELLAERQLDAVLTNLDGSHSEFASRVLYKEPYVLAVPEDHRFARRESVKLADLHDEPFIVRTGCDRFQDASNALVSRGIKIRVVYNTAQIDRTLALVAAGIGISFIPAGSGTPAVKKVRVADMGFFRTFGLFWSRERAHADLNEFIRFAESHSWAQ
ncbi:MAG: LysR family transcriptional regulator [Methylocella sp.]